MVEVFLLPPAIARYNQKQDNLVVVTRENRKKVVDGYSQVMEKT